MYNFTVIVSDIGQDTDDLQTRLYDEGCNDVVVSYKRGLTIVDFAREAASWEDAISTAAETLILADCKIERIEPDPLVNVADIAARAGLSGAAITQYSKAQRRKNFPPPAARITSENPLWIWADVAHWLFIRRKVNLDQAIQAEVLNQANEILASGEQHIGSALKERTHARVYEYKNYFHFESSRGPSFSLRSYTDFGQNTVNVFE